MATDEQKLEKAELYIGYILRWGVLICAAVILTGWIMHSHPIIMAGLLLLIFLPISRVFAAAVVFLMQKDFLFVGLSLYVLAILIFSLFLGKKL